ncbi:MAG TPA: hypothetical protein VMS98_05280 [Thermoanaerobaculia bacterium]|nr:hypothetical protein [Thermoanaerobaculia bacterium]
MKRLALAMLVLFVALPAAAFKTTVRRGDRVGVLRPAEGYGHGVASVVTRSLERELRERGVDATDTRLTFDQLRDDDRGQADFYIEVVRGDGDAHALGGVGVGDSSLGVDLSIVVAHVAARVNLYDGRTFELIDAYDFQRRASAVMPTGIGVGRRSVGLWVALPFVQMARYRAAARAVAAEAADAIVP